ncbi:putative tie-like receptor tyrosine kinase [Apostichopus japonicus]|uniref:Putative tie-like receptor tyrosine kinase n=1 Tax=Stichopus japonicus TaxID=307972 RepID=A0A2G8K2Q8_STIJA|nr:putative tie-like receptor tyrosine kinase [Apostichopus japonicus]
MSASTSDAGIYYAHFDEHPYLGGFTRVIVRECPAGFWGPPDCSESCLDCMHGGICDTITGMCICPPGFMGNLCEKACGSNVYGPECNHSCQADSCRSMQFCLPDPYGCSCATGWAGSTCEVECPDGLYGANCNESCECQNGGSCERHVGCICPDEWTGIHCHRPKFFFNSSTTRVTLADATQITVECGCAPEVEDCPLQDIQIEITNPDPVPPNINRIIDDSDQSSIRWHLTPFGIDGNWDFACSIDYRGNTYTHNLTVTAIGGPFPEIQTFHNLEANRDTTQSMECRVVTTAGEDVKLRNEQGDLIPLSRHVSIGKSSYYFFHIDALDENEGVYTCVATSQSGQTERDAIFNVLDPPVPERAPSIITNINGNVNLRLNTIPFVGDGPLEEIFVEYKLSTSQTWSTTGSLNPSTTTYLLENLNGETQYEVRVVLVRPGERDEGRGEPGPVFTFQTLCSAPSRSVTLQDVSTDGLDSTSLRLEWKNPVGQDFDRINIYYRTVDRVVFEVVEVNDVSATSYVLRGLQQYQIYKVQVKLMKCGYVGPASNVLQRRTKEGAPGPVRELHVHPVSYASVSIIWQRPQNENGNIRYYNISAARAQPGTNLSDVVVQRADHNEISYLMTNLKAATDYVISISAVTILTGPVVTQEVTTKEWVPFAAPTNIRTESSETTLSFTFDAIIESERNGVIEMYEAKLQDPTVTSSAVPPITQNFTQMSVMFDKLTPGRQYTFNVRGWTAVGPGVWSADALSSTMPGGYDGTSGGSPDKDQSDGGNESSTGINLMIVLLVVISCTACFVAALVISVLCARAVSKRRSRAREAEMNNAEEPVMRMSELITQQSLPNEYDNTAASGYLSRPTSPVLSNQELNYWKIPWEAMFLERNIIAEGNFGQVLKATIKRDGEAIEAAVKILKG